MVHGLLNAFTGLKDFMPLPFDQLNEMQNLHDQSKSNSEVLPKLLKYVETNVEG